MQTLQPTLRLGRDVWNRAAMPIEEFHGRSTRLRSAMSDRGLDALLLYGANLNDCGHPTWLANYVVKLPFAALVVLPGHGDPALMFQGATRGRSAAQATTWIEDVRPCWNMAETCLAVLVERGLTKARIGLAGMPRLVPHEDWKTLAAGLPDATLVGAEDIVNRLRAVKSDREIAQVQRAKTIGERALDAIAQGLRPAGESRLAADVMREARMHGAEDIRFLIASPQEPEWAFRPVEDVGFRDGEILSVLLAASWERYWSEAVRTFQVVGDRLDPVWDDDLDRRFGVLVSTLQPGTTTGEWSRAARGAMTPAEAQAIAPYGFGHGIGITPEEWPVLSVRGDARIEPGMCFAVRAALERGSRLILHGDTVIVR